MKRFENPEIEVKLFDVEDILTASPAEPNPPVEEEEVYIDPCL